MAWKQALEGWSVRESLQVLEWQAEARPADLLRILEKRCKAPVPNDVAAAIQATPDMDLLLRWVDSAVDVSTFDEFRADMLTG